MGVSGSQASIRGATQRDLEALASVERAAASLFPPGRVPEGGGTLAANVLEQSLQAGLLFVAATPQLQSPAPRRSDLDGPAAAAPSTVVGFAAARRRERFVHLEEVSVHPNAARQGLGRRLVEEVLRVSRHRGVSGVTLTTFEDLPWNAPFYKSMGFMIIEAWVQGPGYLQESLEHEGKLGLQARVAMIHELG